MSEQPPWTPSEPTGEEPSPYAPPPGPPTFGTVPEVPYQTFGAPPGPPTYGVPGAPYEPVAPPAGSPPFGTVPGAPYGQFAPPPTWPPGPEAQPKKSRTPLLIAILCAVLVIGAAAVVAVAAFGSKSKASQAQICHEAAAGANVVTQSLPNASATVTAGGTPVAGVPAVPAGQSAACTLTITASGITVKAYMAVYDNVSATSGYRALLIRSGFTQEDGSAGSATGTGPLVSPDGNTLVLLIAADGKSAIEELVGPSGG